LSEAPRDAPFATIDWSRPWLAPYREVGAPLAAAVAAGGSVAAALDAASAAPRFVPADALPPDEPYETFVARTGSVPTRDNLHDFFNGLVWLVEPALKSRLNALHVAALTAGGVQARRGPLRDAATLVDENGALFDGPPELLDALIARDWLRLFVELRPLWREARLRLIGHALLEKLEAPRKLICAHVLIGGVDMLDRALDPARLAAKPFAPLPVLGVPDWWAANEAVDFYADAAVFRPPRTSLAGSAGESG